MGGGGGGIFMFTYRKNKYFQKKSVGQNTNQGRRENLRGPGQIFSGGPMHDIIFKLDPSQSHN